MDALIRIVSAFNDRLNSAFIVREEKEEEFRIRTGLGVGVNIDDHKKLTREEIAEETAIGLAPYAAAFGDGRLPKQGETAVIALDTPKSAALLFNRVWGLGDDIPDEVRFGSWTKFEWFQILSLGFLLEYQRHQGSSSFSPTLERAQLVEILERARKKERNRSSDDDFSIEKVATNLLTFTYGGLPSTPDSLDNFMAIFSRKLAESYQREVGVEVQPVYPSAASMNSEYKPGSYNVLVASLSNLELINEEKLEWEQVLEFRRDKNAQRKLTRFLRWADSNLLNLSEVNIAAEIESRLEDYKWATKKHGIKTAVGAVSTVLDPKVLTSIGVVAGSLALGTSPAIGALTGAGIALGKVVVKIIEGSLDLAEQRRTLHPEIAYVLEVKKRLGK